jgi:hypothetical protein
MKEDITAIAPTEEEGPLFGPSDGGEVALADTGRPPGRPACRSSAAW